MTTAVSGCSNQVAKKQGEADLGDLALQLIDTHRSRNFVSCDIAGACALTTGHQAGCTLVRHLATLKIPDTIVYSSLEPRVSLKTVASHLDSCRGPQIEGMIGTPGSK
jgi:hypothetical protein